MNIPTVKIKSDKGRVPYRIINESDFDPKKHEKFDEKAAAGMSLEDALAKLDHKDDAHWTKEGAPDLNVLTELVGKKVTAAAVAKAAPDLKRKKD